MIYCISIYRDTITCFPNHVPSLVISVIMMGLYTLVATCDWLMILRTFNPLYQCDNILSILVSYLQSFNNNVSSLSSNISSVNGLKLCFFTMLVECVMRI